MLLSTDNIYLQEDVMKVLIGAPVRQYEGIFKEYLKSLDILEKPCQVDRFFYLHNSPNLAKHLCKDEYMIVQGEDEYKRDETTHYWDRVNLLTVACLKNELLKKTVEGGYDYFMLVDSDLMLHPKTLTQLLSVNKPIVAEVFWTKWQPDTEPLPNAWDLDQAASYEGSYDLWRQPGIYRVGGTGACILVHRSVIEAGVNYNMLYNLSLWGEDRGFCVRAVARDYTLWLDTHFPCKHLYRQSEYEKYIENGGYETAFSI